MSNRTPALFTDFLEEPTNVCLCVYTHGYLYVFIDTDGLGVLLRAGALFLLLFSRSVVSDFVTLRPAAHQASLSFTIFCNFLKLTSIELVMPSHHLIRSPLSF